MSMGQVGTSWKKLQDGSGFMAIKKLWLFVGTKTSPLGTTRFLVVDLQKYKTEKFQLKNNF
jgi:hypothetical protein